MVIQAKNNSSLFSKSCTVSADIKASPETIWALMTNASQIPRWNSTVISLSGEIVLGNTIELVSTLDPNRTFKLKVTTLDKPHLMIWEDGFAPMFKGVRTYQLIPKGTVTQFTMTEVFSGLMLPMIGGSLPDFRANFEQFVKDLKQEAE